jgi:MoxR-like ATPase
MDDRQLQRAADAILGIRREINRAVVGQDDVVDQTLQAFLSGGHVLIEGVPGLGKTLMVVALSKAIGGDFKRIQFTPDLMPADVMGHAIYEGTDGGFRVRKGPVFTNLLLADEINRAPAKTQSALLEAMQERQVSIEGDTYPLPGPFMTLATQNPVEQDGTYPLPEAQLDRFLYKVQIDYPGESEEFDIVERVTGDRVGHTFKTSDVRQVIEIDQAEQLQQMCAQVSVDRRIIEYAVRLVRATRDWAGLDAGAGPRAAIASVRGARAAALMQGRDHVLPDDIQRVAIPAMRHRVKLAPEVEIDRIPPEDILREIIDDVDVPRR